MKKITFLFLLLANFMFAQTGSVDVSELSDVASVDVLANFGGNFDFYPAADQGNDIWTFDFSTSTDGTNEYLWRVTFVDNSTDQEAMASKVAGKGLDNDIALASDFNTDYNSYCNRIMTIGGEDQLFYFNSFRIPGVDYTELVVNGTSGNFHYMRYSVNEFNEFGGPGCIDNGNGTHTALVRPDIAFEYLWNNDDTSVEEDLLDCENDGVQINTDNQNYANRIHAAGVADNDIFDECPQPLSIGEFEANFVSAYPNPTQSVWNFKTNYQIINVIQIIDIQGRIVLENNLRSTEVIIDANSLPSGIYFSRIYTSEGINEIKLIKL
jgi:hypothetical protein